MNSGNEKNTSRVIINVLFISIGVKIIGFFKQAVMAAIFGSTLQTDIYFIATELFTNIGSALFASLVVIIIPDFLNIKSRHFDERNKYLSEIINSFSIISVGIILIIELFAVPLAKILAPSYSGSELDTLVLYLRLLSPTLFLMCLNYIMQAILECEKQFSPSKCLGAIHSSAIIIAALTFGKSYGISCLVVSFAVSQVLELLFLLQFAKKYFHLEFVKRIFDAHTKRVIKLMLPLCIGNAVADISVVIDKIIATNLGEGVASSLSYGQTLKSFVSTTLITTIVSVLFVYLADYVIKGDYQKIYDLLDEAISLMVIILVPVSIISFASANDIVEVVFQRGSFDSNATSMTSSVLKGYAVGFVPCAIRSILIKVHYAFRDSRRPMNNGITAILINIALSIALSKVMGIIGITLATSISYVVSMIFSFVTLKSHLSEYSKRAIGFLCLKLLPSTLVCILCVSVIENLLSIPAIFRLILSSIFCFSLHFGYLYMFKIPERVYLQKLLRIILKKKNREN